ncbi:protein MAIN-LIKE 2-like [Medicago truncatula]|uniref:protein MAIN-LIKE 2-like n=1 Tax=Medicago truncatula TaxID=3880 RepID=UPI000D2F2E4A|nr:protein MAIN-LIKE 2-like [Medicago truncatula]
MEVKEDHMLSPAGDSEPILRIAHFLKPISNTIEEPPSGFNPSSLFDPEEWPLKINFIGWPRPVTEKWVYWVDQLKPKFEYVWKKVGIFEAIMSTKCCIKKDHNLLFGVVEKWCCETNTFVFPFGEATITLEDVMVLGGYPILGDPVFITLQDQEMKEVEKELILERQQLYKTKSANARTRVWMDVFIDKGNELEHEAFLATWLSIFVHPYKSRVVNSSFFRVAIHLARGNPIALAPAVLASLYKDLGLLKNILVNLSKLPVGGDRLPMEAILQSPFYLVQVWVWERFKNLQPQPMLINYEDPFLFRWHNAESENLNVDNVRLELNSAKNHFLWRPYVRFAEKCELFYPNDGTWVFKTDLDDTMLSFVRCMRVSELVGIDFVVQYLPHRVALQFGMDQDIPSYVPRFNETESVAWENYNRPISDEHVYFPSRLFEADVTTRYAEWWKKFVPNCNNFVKKTVQQKRSASPWKHRPCEGNAKESGNDDGESCRYALRNRVSSSNNATVAQHNLQFHSDMAAGAKQTLIERKESDDDVLVFLKEKYLKNQEELTRLAREQEHLERQQEEVLQLINSREKREEVSSSSSLVF